MELSIWFDRWLHFVFLETVPAKAGGAELVGTVGGDLKLSA